MNNLQNLKEASALQNLKFSPKSEEHSEAIQKKLFGMGYGWVFTDKEVQRKNARYLYAYSRGDITYDYGDPTYFANKNHLDLTETFVPLKLKLDGTTSYLEGVDIPEGAQVAIKYSGRIIFFKEDDGHIQSHNGLCWIAMLNPYKHSLLCFATVWDSGRSKVIWQKDKSPLSKPSDLFCSASIQERISHIVVNNNDEVIVNLKLEYIKKFLQGIDIQYRVGKAVGSDKSQWHKLTWESLKDMKHDIVEFREKPKHVSIDGIVFDTEESLLKYVRKNFDLTGDK